MRASGGLWVFLPAALALLVGGWGIAEPSLWRDESVSGMVARLPFDRFWAVLGDLDAVHAAYYLLLRPFAALGGAPELLLRLPSLLAFAATAYGVAVLGRRLAGPLAGLAAGVIYALLPIASRYAQEARSYAIVSAVAVLATWLLVDLLDRERPPWWSYAGYAAAVALLGWLHVYALLLLPAHALAVALARRRPLPGSSPVPAGLRRLVGWACALAGAGVALLPLVVVASGQRETQVWWLEAPTLSDLAAFPFEIAGGTAASAVVFALAAFGAWTARRTPFVVAWVILPVALSLALSQVQPIYHPRYLLFVVPGVALAAGIGVAAVAERIPRRPARAVALGAALVLLAGLTFGTQLDLRRVDSRPDDLRGMTRVLDAESRPGDAVLFVPQRYLLFVGIYGGPYERLTDVTRAAGSYEPYGGAQIALALRGVRRVWLVSPWIGARYRDDERLRALRKRFKPGPVRAFGDVRLTLYEASR